MVGRFVEVDDFVNNIVSAVARGGNLIVVIAPHHGNFPTLEYIFDYIAFEKDVDVYFIYISNPPDNIGCFDKVIDCKSSIDTLIYILELIPNVSIYIQAHAKWIFLSELVRKLKPESIIVHEVYDWISYFSSITENCGKNTVLPFSNEELSKIILYENNLHQYIDCLVFKGGDYPNSENLIKHSIPVIELLPCPPSSWMVLPKFNLSADTPKLVYAGQIKSREYYPEFFGDLYYIPVIHALTDQELPVTIYTSVASNWKDCEDLFGEYLTEQKKNPLFSILPGVPVRSLLSKLSNEYDFGLIVHYFPSSLQVGVKHLETAMASKLFTYLAAGLPVLVSAELKCMAEWVDDHHVGIVIEQDEIIDIYTIIMKYDYDYLCSNVKKVQEMHILEASAEEIYNVLVK